MPSSSRKSASAVWITASNSLERWLISITDMPVPLKSSNSACAFSRTSSGRTAGPGLKLKTRLGLDMECTPVFIDLQTRTHARVVHIVPPGGNSDTNIHFTFHYIVCQTNHQERLALFSPDLCR